MTVEERMHRAMFNVGERRKQIMTPAQKAQYDRVMAIDGYPRQPGVYTITFRNRKAGLATREYNKWLQHMSNSNRPTFNVISTNMNDTWDGLVITVTYKL